jgi:hypothetical protein
MKLETHLMKAIFPAFCGALLLATSLPALAKPATNEFGGAAAKAAAAGQVQRSIELGSLGATRQVDRSTVGTAGSTVERQTVKSFGSTANAGAGSAYIAPRGSSTLGRSSTIQPMNWSTDPAAARIRQNLGH